MPGIRDVAHWVHGPACLRWGIIFRCLSLGPFAWPLCVFAERAFRCSVCRALFSVPPPQPRATTVVVPLLRGVCALLCVALLTFGLSGAPLLACPAPICLLSLVTLGWAGLRALV